jgi:8-oxo-dGTP pyrophosphatase MutT (NUDIX family)
MPQNDFSYLQKKLGSNFHVPTVPAHWKVAGDMVIHDHGFVADVDATFVDESGKQYNRTLLFRRDAASVLVVARPDDLAQAAVLLTHQFRLGVGESLLELPGGMIEYAEGESPRAAAIRELEEEVLGFPHESIQKVTSLGKYYMDPARSVHSRYAYMVEVDYDATTIELAGESEELVEGTMWLSLHDVIQLMRRHKIRDALTMAVLGTYLSRYFK